jgi:hypothetical protein
MHFSSCFLGACQLQLNVPDSLVYILFDITYGLNNQNHIRAPIIFVRYKNWQPDYQLNAFSCQSNQTIRNADSKNFSHTSQKINVTECYCCAMTVLWETCPNAVNIPSTFTIDPINTTVSLNSTTTVAISTSASISTTHIGPAPSTSTKAISTTTDRPPTPPSPTPPSRPTPPSPPTPVTPTNTTPTQETTTTPPSPTLTPVTTPTHPPCHNGTKLSAFLKSQVDDISIYTLITLPYTKHNHSVTASINFVNGATLENIFLSNGTHNIRYIL